MGKATVEKAKRHLTPALSWDTEIVARQGDGAYLIDGEGRRYLDFSCGTATNNLGHCHPRVVRAARGQMERLVHAGGVYYYESIADLAGELARVCPGPIDTFFFSNSGAEAVEGCLKLARAVTGRSSILAFEGSFHGRTLGALSLTSSSSKYRRGYGPLLPGVYHAPFPYRYRSEFGEDPKACTAGCLQRIEKILSTVLPPEDLAAVVIEPVQGEGGYIDAPDGFLVGLREICDEVGALLIFDEVQTGFGRTARWFASEHSGVIPDVMAVAKGIASGFPVSAVCARRELMGRWSPGAHGTTFGGNPVSCAAAAETIRTIREEKLLEHAQRLADLAWDHLASAGERFPIVGDVRGKGLMIGIELVEDGATKRPAPEAVATARRSALEQGLILISCGTFGNVLRLIPPLVTTEEQMEGALRILDDSLRAAAK